MHSVVVRLNYSVRKRQRKKKKKEKKRKRKTAVTRETKCSRPCVDEVAEEAQVDGGKGVPATRRPNRVGVRLGTRGMVGVGIDRMVSDGIGLHWHVL